MVRSLVVSAPQLPQMAIRVSSRCFLLVEQRLHKKKAAHHTVEERPVRAQPTTETRKARRKRGSLPQIIAEKRRFAAFLTQSFSKSAFIGVHLRLILLRVLCASMSPW